MKPAFPDGIWPRYKVFFLESMLLWVREDLVDHGPLRDAGDEAHHAVARGRSRVALPPPRSPPCPAFRGGVWRTSHRTAS